MLILLQKTRQQPGNVGTVGQQYPYPLTQITSDGQHYALLSMNKDTQKLVTGSLAGGVPTTLVEHNFGNSNVLILAGIGVF